MQVNDRPSSPLILDLRINHFCNHLLPILCVESENLNLANCVINTYAYERIIIMTLKYDKSLEQIGRQYNCMAKTFQRDRTENPTIRFKNDVPESDDENLWNTVPKFRKR